GYGSATGKACPGSSAFGPTCTRGSKGIDEYRPTRASAPPLTAATRTIPAKAMTNAARPVRTSSRSRTGSSPHTFVSPAHTHDADNTATADNGPRAAPPARADAKTMSGQCHKYNE